MVLDLQGASNDAVSWSADKLSPLVGGPITTAIFIVIIIMIIALLTFNSSRGVIKMTFWSLLATLVIIFIHDSVVTSAAKSVLEQREMAMHNYIPPINNGAAAITPNTSVTGQAEKREKIRMPLMSFEKYSSPDS